MLRKVLLAVGLSLVIVVVLLMTWKARADARYFDAYDPTVPLNVYVAEVREEEGYKLEKFYFDSTPGETVPTFMTLPATGEGPFPCAIFLHGIGQEKEFLEEITRPFNEAGFALASFDQYTRGERKIPKEAGRIAEAKGFLQRPARTVNDTRRLIDYLQTDKRIDPNRIYMFGASYGAITGSTATAFDQRLKAAILVYGGGDLNKLLRAKYIVEGAKQEGMGLALTLARPILTYLLAPADPVNYIDGIAPRPVLFQNGRFDGLVSPEAAQAFQDAAKDPKEIVWYESDHIGMDEDMVRRVLNDALVWIQKQDQIIREASAAKAAA
jgi:dienelactone hydrolase